jgi:tetratricopeptide (TPR) repeat protein
MSRYDAFISYSHAKDKPIAAALQSVIQRIGKPWYSRRSVRVFRDDTSLSATPHLWPAIETALSQSRFLILLASPESAASKWVNREVAYWLGQRSIDTLLIGLTDGELVWDEASGDFRQHPDRPLPPLLAGRFPVEPKWVDLRAYRDRADRRSTSFIELGAEFAAAVRGMPKEDLLSEEVHQQRRALTLALTAATLLFLFAGLAAWQWKAADDAGALAVAQKKEAEAQRDSATRSFILAKGTADSLVINIVQGLRHVEGMRAESVRRILETAKATFDQLAAAADSLPHNQFHFQRSRGMMLIEFGNTYLIVGDHAAARANFDASRAIFERLVALDPTNGRWQYDLSTAWARSSKLLQREGKIAEALAAYRNALVIRERLVNSDPENPEWQQGVALAQDGMAILLEADGNFADALKAYNVAREIRERLLAVDPEQAICECELASSWRYIGNVLKSLGNLSEAIEDYRKSLAIMQRLVRSQPENADWRRDVALSHEGIGKLLEAQGDRPGALAEHRAALGVRERLVKDDPENVQWLMDLLSSYWCLAGLADEPERRLSFIAATVRSLELRKTLTDDQKRMLADAEARLQKPND